MYRHYNPNPCGKAVGDCVIRAVSKIENISWEQAYISMCVFGYVQCDMPSSNNVWASYLRSRGYKQFAVGNNCPLCYTVKDFCREHPEGSFILGTGTHAIAVINGDYYDAWDSGDEVIDRYFTREW